MVKNMKNHEILISKIESYFKELEIVYDYIDLQDDDINYILNISTIGKLKPLNSIPCMLYFSETDFSMNLIVLNIYNIKKNDDTLKLYKIVNEANTETKIGNFTIIANESGNKKIVYRSLVNCGNDFSNLSKRLIKFQILSFISPLEKILFSLKEL